MSRSKCCWLLVCFFVWESAGNLGLNPVFARQEKGQPDRDEEPLALDVNGDPLPTGAIARLGTSYGRPLGLLRFLADGKTMLAAGRFERTIYLRDAFTGKALRRFEMKGQVECADFSPDGKTVILIDRAQAKGAYFLREIATDKEIAELHGGKGSAPLGASFSPDGSLIATSRDNIAVWDARTGKKLYELSLGAKCPNFAFSADSKVLSTGVALKGFMVNRWDARTGNKLDTLTYEDGKLTSATFSPDGQLLAVWGSQTSGMVADAKSGKELYKTTGAAGRVFSPQGDLLAVHGKGGIRILDARTGKERSRIDQGFVFLVFSPDGKRVAATLSAQTIGLWEVASGRDLHPRQRGHPTQIFEVALSADEKAIYAAGSSFISIWDLPKRQLIRRLGGDDVDPAKRDFLAHGRLLASMNLDGPLQIWDRDGQEKDRLEGLGRVRSLDLAPDGKTLAVLTMLQPNQAAGAIDVRLWDIAANKELPRPPIEPVKNPGPLPMAWAGVAFSPDGKLLATNDSQNIYLWQVGTQNKPRAIPGRWKTSNPSMLRFSPDGRFLAAASLRQCFVLDLGSGEVRPMNLAGIEGADVIEGHYSLVFSSDSRMLVTGSFASIRLWELETGEERIHLKSGANGLAFTSDQNLLVSGGFDSAILLWDMNRLALTGAQAKGKLQPVDLSILWSGLAAKAKPAFVAQQCLAAFPEIATPFLAERLRRKPVEPQRLTELIARFEGKTLLGAETASNELVQLGTLAEDRLRDALRGKPADEVRLHLERTIQKIEESSDRRRELRAIETLERIGTAETLRILANLAKELPSLRLRQEAQQSAGRVQANLRRANQ
jgi:WD40 repeat protein